MMELDEHMRSIYDYYGFDFLDYYDNGKWKTKKIPKILVKGETVGSIIAFAAVVFGLYAFMKIIMDTIAVSILGFIWYIIVYIGLVFVAFSVSVIGGIEVYDENGDKKTISMYIYIFLLIIFFDLLLVYNKMRLGHGKGELLGFIQICFLSSVIGYLMSFILRARFSLKSINKCNYIVNEKKKDFDFLEKLSIIVDTTSMKNMGKAVEYYNMLEYEDALVYVRKAMECYLYEWLICCDRTFKDKTKLNISNIVKYYSENCSNYKIIDSLELIHRICNGCAHANVRSKSTIDGSSADLVIKEMFQVLIMGGSVFTSNVERFGILNEQINKYMNKSKKYAESQNVIDVFLNLRKTLECVVNGYMHYYHVVCTYGHGNNLSGHIDVLYEKGYITEKSKSNMHFIRMLGNQGAHQTDTEEIKKMIPAIKVMEDEIKKYKKIIEESDNQYYEELCWDEENISDVDDEDIDDDEDMDDDFEEHNKELFKSYDDYDDEIVESRSRNIFDSDDEEDMTPRDMIHPEEYSDMNHYWDTSRYFDLNKYF